MADHSDLASDVMAVNDSIMRYCHKCGYSTLWKQAVPGSTLPSDVEQPTRPAVSPPAESFGAAGPPATLEMAERVVNERGVSERQVKERHSSFAGATLMETEISTEAAKLEPATSGLYSSDRDDSVLTGGDHGEAAKAQAPSAATSSAGVAVKEKDRENRRKHARTRVNFKACVRRPGLADDVVACEDMSRGGLRFKSSRKYFEKMLIDVAVPYSPGDQAIFVPAQIAYVQELPEQNTYRCGVMYLRSSAR